MRRRTQKFKQVYNPTPDEIREGCKEIQARWSKLEELHRRRWTWELFSLPFACVVKSTNKNYKLPE